MSCSPSLTLTLVSFPVFCDQQPNYPMPFPSVNAFMHPMQIEPNQNAVKTRRADELIITTVCGTTSPLR